MRPRQPGQEMKGRRSKYGVRENNDDILNMSPEEVDQALETEYERARELGYGDQLEHRADAMIEKMLEAAYTNADPSRNSGVGINISEEEFIQNWKRNIEGGGGEVDPRFALRVIRDINDAVDAGWLEIPDNVLIVIRRENKDFDRGSQAHWAGASAFMEGATGKVEIFQNVEAQGDSINKALYPDAGQYNTLEEWLGKTKEPAELSPEGPYAGVTFTGYYFGGGMGAVVLHELGHRFDDESMVKVEGGYRSLSIPAQGRLDWGYRYSKDEDQKEQYNQTSRLAKEMVSYYATESPGEFVAEIYSISNHPDFDSLGDYRKEYILS
ncbi:MAG: hypothetical protein KAI64_04240, partial [Thermoplasmata archaeon]|nr:hypothetical protein [Thermoplasmata archaeon]